VAGEPLEPNHACRRRRALEVVEAVADDPADGGPVDVSAELRHEVSGDVGEAGVVRCGGFGSGGGKDVHCNGLPISSSGSPMR
jgi:hypothetical protein